MELVSLPLEIECTMATELTIDRKGRYIIPYFDGPIQIIDHEYDLVLLVQQ